MGYGIVFTISDSVVRDYLKKELCINKDTTGNKNIPRLMLIQKKKVSVSLRMDFIECVLNRFRNTAFMCTSIMYAENNFNVFSTCMNYRNVPIIIREYLKQKREQSSEFNVLKFAYDKLQRTCNLLDQLRDAYDFNQDAKKFNLQHIIDLFNDKEIIHMILPCLSEVLYENHKCTIKNQDKYWDSHIDALTCEILGLDESLQSSLPKGEIRHHKSLLQWLLNYFEQRFEELKDMEDELSLQQKLEFVGFKKSKAKVLKKIISKNMDSMKHHKDVYYWIENYLELVFGNENEKSFPFNSNDVNKWYTRDGKPSSSSSSSSSNNSQSIKYMNVTKDVNEVKRLLKKEISQHGDKKLLFHGTTIKNALNIIENGILFRFTNSGDFSERGKGFYTSQDLDHSRKFAVCKTFGTTLPAILVYEIDKDIKSVELEGSKYFKGIDIAGNVDLQNLAKDYYIYGKGKKEPKEFKNLDYIEGPTSGCDGWNVCESSIHQLCVRTERLAEYFDKHLAFCMFFEC